MRLSEQGAELIAEFEGFRSKPYRDPVGIWTIGFGSTKGVTRFTRPVTREQALARMMREVDATYGAAVNRLGLPLNQNQFDALTSFVYNVGPGGIGPDTKVGRALRNRQFVVAADALLAWDKAGGRALPGLTRRRRAERALFLKAEDRWAGYTPWERRAIAAYDRGTRAQKAALRPAIAVQRKRVYRSAKANGWTPSRRKRYASLKARS